MSLENGIAQIIKLLPTRLAHVPLSITVAVRMPAFLDVRCIAVRAVNPIRPAQGAHYFIALRIINQLLDTYHARILPHRSLPHLLETR